ncbi:PDR/VanB family oxidoreductase [Variovorax sp. Sphag1AA]|uniref:PDR/VanB family oxidoreductase n=1 Tax=Variovorax sp. Sphag1AA TaxID=2587027 RepID=UPI00161575CB|nr:PDR/VanB family oxidoreductase [Variovorax sp. Sphag1AA]MBB3182435.1 vanillate O-demethylase ferredoxin subunit [Variovorax sp. Sphag1AA]
MEVVELDSSRTDEKKAVWLHAVVVAAETVASDILLLRLESPNDEVLAAYEPGAHVAIQCGTEAVRHYSLTGPGRESGVYELGIKLAPEGTGGSRWLFEHATPGTRIALSVPRNHFPLVDGAGPFLFISGGIGITPIISMLYALKARGVRARLVHLCRDPASLGFGAWLSELASFHQIHVHHDSQATALYDLEAEIWQAPEGAHVYCCGPSGLMDAVREVGEAAGLTERLHFEFFEAPVTTRDISQDAEFTVVQHSTGREIPVAPTQTMLGAIREAGIVMKSECEYGVCGWCAVDVVDGMPAHFDSYLTDAEKRANKLVLPCVSRCKSARITLDI